MTRESSIDQKVAPSTILAVYLYPLLLGFNPRNMWIALQISLQATRINHIIMRRYKEYEKRGSILRMDRSKLTMDRRVFIAGSVAATLTDHSVGSGSRLWTKCHASAISGCGHQGAR